MSFTVAIVGRPNVGKSTLFNRLAGRKLALVDDTPGVTRDRRPGEARLVDLEFRIIDTAGLEESGPDTLEGRMRAQTELAIDEADLSLFLIDAKTGLTPLDATLAEVLRKRGKPVVLVANKAEARGAESGLYDAYALGLGEPCPISAEHGEGMLDLRDAIVAALGEERAFPPAAEEAVTDVDVAEAPAGADEEGEEVEPAYDATRPMRVAIVGRPNAGKSTLINRLLGEERLLTGPEAGITRDSISVDLEWRGRKIKMFDTAGLRRKARVQEKLEKLSVADALRAIRFAEVVVIVLDATIPFEKQDLQIADLVSPRGPRGGDRLQQVGHDRRPAGGARRPAREDRAAVAAGARHPRRADRRHDRRRPEPPDAGDRGDAPHLEPSHSDGQAQPLAGGDAGRASAAGGGGPASQAEIHDPDQGASARLRHLLHAAGGVAGFLHALPCERPSRRFRPAGRADSHRLSQG